jgi:hypothetical protein
MSRTNKDGVRYDHKVYTEEEVDDLLEHIRKRAVCPIDLKRQGDSLLRKAARIQREYNPQTYILHPNHNGYKEQKRL